MRNKLSEIFFGRNLKVSGLLVLGIMVFIGLGCFGGRKTAGTIPAAYLGDWQGQDGTTISIRGDGTGDYHSGGTKVDGGTAEVNEADKKLSITFFGIGKTLKIDQPPTGDQMRLDGIDFRRKGGFTDSTSSNPSTPILPSSSPTSRSPFPTDETPVNVPNTSPNTSQNGLPSNIEIETLVKATVSDFAIGVDEGDFTTFRNNSSKDFQATLSPAQVNAQFQVFIDRRNDFLPSLRSADSTSAEFSTSPYIRTEKGYQILVTNGQFSTSPHPIMFQTEYELEKGRWKLLTFRIKI